MSVWLWLILCKKKCDNHRLHLLRVSHFTAEMTAGLIKLTEKFVFFSFFVVDASFWPSNLNCTNVRISDGVSVHLHWLWLFLHTRTSSCSIFRSNIKAKLCRECECIWYKFSRKSACIYSVNYELQRVASRQKPPIITLDAVYGHLTLIDTY